LRVRGAVAIQDVTWHNYDDFYTLKAKDKHKISDKGKLKQYKEAGDFSV